MARVKLVLPEKIIYTCTDRVRITDINYGNHLGNDAIVRLVHEARMGWLHQHYFTETDIAGAGLIMADLAVEFKAEGFYGDVLEMKVACGEITRAGFDLYYEITAIRGAAKTVLALAKTGMVCYDYSNKKVMAIPAVLMPLLQ
jgi:acyl-CoA thioester hydrolase